MYKYSTETLEKKLESLLEGSLFIQESCLAPEEKTPALKKLTRRINDLKRSIATLNEFQKN